VENPDDMRLVVYLEEKNFPVARKSGMNTPGQVPNLRI
jgi:hypothetical protein